MQKYKNVICTGCSALCDDIQVTVNEKKIISVQHACPIGVAKFMSVNEERLLHPRINGKNVTLEQALEKATEILTTSRYPLLYGWSNTSTEAVRYGIYLAEALGGVFDSTSSVCHGPTVIGMQDRGLPTATLGQIKNRADLIIFWGSNPLNSHPRHLIRYSLFPEGRFVKGRKNRKMIVVDVRKTDTARLADEFIKINPNSDFEIITALRLFIKGLEPSQDYVGGVPVTKLKELAETMLSSKFGVIFFGLGLTMSHGKSRNVEAAIALVQDLNKHTKFVIHPMRGHFNVTGADNVACWLTGFPFAVDFSRGYPFYNPGDTTAVDVLRRNFVDAALIVASDPVSHMPIRAARNLAHIPLVVLSPHENFSTKVATVVIPTAITGIEAGGTAYRMDGVPIKLKKIIDPPENILFDEIILKKSYNRVLERL